MLGLYSCKRTAAEQPTRTCPKVQRDGMCRITSAQLQDVKSEKELTDETVKAVLATSLKSKKKNKKKKAAKVENGQPEAEE